MAQNKTGERLLSRLYLCSPYRRIVYGFKDEHRFCTQIYRPRRSANTAGRLRVRAINLAQTEKGERGSPFSISAEFLAVWYTAAKISEDSMLKFTALGMVGAFALYTMGVGTGAKFGTEQDGRAAALPSLSMLALLPYWYTAAKISEDSMPSARQGFGILSPFRRDRRPRRSDARFWRFVNLLLSKKGIPTVFGWDSFAYLYPFSILRNAHRQSRRSTASSPFKSAAAMSMLSVYCDALRKTRITSIRLSAPSLLTSP